ncbi:hypothetical protein [Rhizobium sp. R693]|uniref:hypothetical protein n=1 Tax=Rhizobium sp. R693 TaxID=1764276 RepID=UPI00167B81B5
MPKPLDDQTSISSRATSDEQWSKACRIARVLVKVLEDGDLKQAAVTRAAADLRLTTRQVYNLLARYRTQRTVTALLPRAVNRRERLPEPVEEIINTTLHEQWLTLEAPPLAPVVAEIRARCKEAGLAPPSHVTVARCIPVFKAAVARRRSARHVFPRMDVGQPSA